MDDLQRQVESQRREIDDLRRLVAALGPPRKRFDDAAASSNQLAFLVTRIGGVSGTNKSAKCTYTYTIYAALDTGKTLALGTALSVTGNGNGWRALKLALTAGSHGAGYQNADGTYTLTTVNEYPAGEQDCS